MKEQSQAKLFWVFRPMAAHIHYLTQNQPKLVHQQMDLANKAMQHVKRATWHTMRLQLRFSIDEFAIEYAS